MTVKELLLPCVGTPSPPPVDQLVDPQGARGEAAVIPSPFERGVPHPIHPTDRVHP